MKTISPTAESRSYAPIHPAARTHRRLAAAAGWAQRAAGAADAAHRLGALAALVADLHAAPVGRPSYPPLLMVKVLLLQAVVPGLGPGDGRGVVGNACRFGASWGWGCRPPPDHSTISRFRTQLAAAGLAESLFAAVEEQLATRGVLVKQGTLGGRDVGGRAGAPPAGWDDRRGQPQGPGRGLGPAGAGRRALATSCTWGWTLSRNWSRRAVLTPANVNETQVADEADRGGRRGRVRGCGLWHARAQRPALRVLGIQDRLMRRPSKHHPR